MFTQRIQEIGNRFGRLKVVGHADTDKHRHARWVCQCDCGEECIRTGTELRRHIVQSCGCLQIEAATATIQKHNRMLGHFGLPDSSGMITRNGVRYRPLVPVSLVDVPGVKFQPIR